MLRFSLWTFQWSRTVRLFHNSFFSTKTELFIEKFHLTFDSSESYLSLKLYLYTKRNTLAFCITLLSILLLPGSSGLPRWHFFLPQLLDNSFHAFCHLLFFLRVDLISSQALDIYPMFPF